MPQNPLLSVICRPSIRSENTICGGNSIPSVVGSVSHDLNQENAGLVGRALAQPSKLVQIPFKAAQLFPLKLADRLDFFPLHCLLSSHGSTKKNSHSSPPVSPIQTIKVEPPP